MTLELVDYEVSEGIAVGIINRPPANALNSQLNGELLQVFEDLRAREDVFVVILTAVGTKFFVGGADISELLLYNTVEDGSRFSAQGHRLMNTIERFDRPVIAAVNGYAVGGGCELAMACDMRIAAESARFGQPEANLGIIPGAGGTQRLPRLVGKGKAKDLVMSGDLIDAAEAQRIGLVDRVVPDIELVAQARALAKKIAAKGPLAIRLIKKAVNEGMDMSLDDGLKLEISLFGRACAAEDKNEGVNAFLEKRAPQFRSRWTKL